jgi:hypothetical protein
MKTPSGYTRRRRRLRRPEEQDAENQYTSARVANQVARLGPYYSAGPVYELTPRTSTEEMDSAEEAQEQSGVRSINADEDAQSQPGMASDPGLDQQPLPALEGEGEPIHAVAFNQRGPLRLHGRTDATYDGGRFETENVTVRPGEGCAGCRGRQCIRASGTLVAHYQVQTSVTLPSVSDFPGLTPCQQRRVQNAIDNILAPHEQEHVRAFETYNGETRRTFDLTLCRGEFDGAIQRMFDAEAQARRAAAQAASDALDPFHFDVDLNCEEPAPQGQSAAAFTSETPPEEERLV